MPALGFGTWELADGPGGLEQDTYDLVSFALRSGFRHLDCALAYGNESAVGRAIADSGVPRGELFVATKFSNFLRGATPASVAAACDRQLEALGVAYVDVYMLHAPAGTEAETLSLWRAMEGVHAAAKARALGVCNFNSGQLASLLRDAHVWPSYVQNKLSVYHPGDQNQLADQQPMVEFCSTQGLRFVGYSCLNAWPAVLPPTADPHVAQIARRRGCTPAQVLIRWALQLGACVLVRSRSRAHIEENLAALRVRLSRADMQLLAGLAQLQHSTPEGLVPELPGGDVYGLAAAHALDIPAPPAQRQHAAPSTGHSSLVHGRLGAELRDMLRAGSKGLPSEDLGRVQGGLLALLRALHDAYADPDFQAEVKRIHRGAGGGGASMLSMLAAAAARVQDPVFQRFGLPAGQKGVVLMKGAAKAVGRKSSEVRELSGDLRELLGLERVEVPQPLFPQST